MVDKEKKRLITQGQAGVFAVASQLCLRGLNPMFPAVDDGVDIVLTNGLRLQVKTARITYHKLSSSQNDGSRGGKTDGYRSLGSYGFGLRRGEWLSGSRRYVRVRRSYKEVADFFVLWGIDEDRFWIVPTSIMNRAIWFSARDRFSSSNNSAFMTVTKEQRSMQYENRWDLLDVDATLNSVLAQPETETIKKENS